MDGTRISGDDSNVIYFDTADEAAKKHDEVVRAKEPKGKVEYNFNEDGSRIVYEDVSTTSTTGLGGGASSVVPALSVINIKVSLSATWLKLLDTISHKKSTTGFASRGQAIVARP